MTPEETLVDALDAAGVKAYPAPAPNNAPYPHAVYQRVLTIPQRTHEGYIHERARFQITSWAQHKGDAIVLAANVRATLDLNTADFELATFNNQFDAVETDGLYRVIQEYHVWYV